MFVFSAGTNPRWLGPRFPGAAVTLVPVQGSFWGVRAGQSRGTSGSCFGTYFSFPAGLYAALGKAVGTTEVLGFC